MHFFYESESQIMTNFKSFYSETHHNNSFQITPSENFEHFQEGENLYKIQVQKMKSETLKNRKNA